MLLLGGGIGVDEGVKGVPVFGSIKFDGKRGDSLVVDGGGGGDVCGVWRCING